MREYIVPYNNIIGEPTKTATSFHAYPNNMLMMFVSYAGIHALEPADSWGLAHEYFHDIWYCKSGQLVVTIKGKEHDICKGDLFIVHRGSPFTLRTDEKKTCKLVFIGVQGPGAERLTKLSAVYQYNADTFLRIEHAFSQNIRSQELYLSFAYEIFYYLFQGEPEKIDFAKWIDNFIRMEYPNKISIADMAEKLHRNRCYLSQLYKETYGISIKEAIIRIRMDKAVEYLKEGHSVAETGKMVGYPDAFSFSRMFSKTIGVPPTQISKESKKKRGQME